METRKETVAVFRAMAELAVIPIQSILTDDDVDDDLTPVGHVAESIKIGAEGEASPQTRKALIRLRKPQQIRR